MLDQHGARARLDDALGHTSRAVLHTRATPGVEVEAWRRTGVPVVQLRPAGSDPAADVLVDIENVLVRRFGKLGVTAVAVRPDGSSTRPPAVPHSRRHPASGCRECGTKLSTRTARFTRPAERP